LESSQRHETPALNDEKQQNDCQSEIEDDRHRSGHERYGFTKRPRRNQ